MSRTCDRNFYRVCYYILVSLLGSNGCREDSLNHLRFCQPMPIFLCECYWFCIVEVKFSLVSLMSQTVEIYRRNSNFQFIVYG